MGKAQFYKLWLAKTFIRPLLVVDLLAGLLAIIFGAITYYHPEWGGTMSFLAWSIPLVIGVASVIIGFLLAPYYIYRDSEGKRKELQLEADNQQQGESLLNRLERLKDVWNDSILNEGISNDLEFEQWKTMSANWKGNVTTRTQLVKPIQYTTYNRRGYNAEHISLLSESDVLHQDIKATINHLKTRL